MKRITMDTDVNGGKPSIREMRFAVSQLLELLASGMTTDEILTGYPYLEPDNIGACLQYAAFIANTKSILPFAS